MEAARIKQQESYNKNLLEQKNKEKDSGDESKTNDADDKKPDVKPQSLFSNSDYFPLANNSSSYSYRPAKKKTCGPCGGGC